MSKDTACAKLIHFEEENGPVYRQALVPNTKQHTTRHYVDPDTKTVIKSSKVRDRVITELPRTSQRVPNFQTGTLLPDNFFINFRKGEVITYFPKYFN